MQTGTVPVERLWSNLGDFIPDAARTVSLHWFRLLADLGFLRFNYRHFNHASLPDWTEGDVLLAERIDTQDGDIGAMTALQAEFATNPAEPLPSSCKLLSLFALTRASGHVEASAGH